MYKEEATYVAQEIVDCTCNGNMSQTVSTAYKYVMKKGVAHEEDYPYVDKRGACKCYIKHTSGRNVLYIDDYKFIWGTSKQSLEAHMMSMLMKQHIVAKLDWRKGDKSFQNYRRGLFRPGEILPPHCYLEEVEDISSHGVVIVGCGKVKRDKFWIVQNSWGPNWGEDGYALIPRGDERYGPFGVMGINSSVSYPIIRKSTRRHFANGEEHLTRHLPRQWTMSLAIEREGAKVKGGEADNSSLVLNQPFLVDTLNRSSGLTKPPTTSSYAAKKYLELREQKVPDLLDSITDQETILGSRSKRLKETLEDCGWEVLEAYAGVSMVVKPSSYLGKTVKLNRGDGTACEVELDDTNIRESMLKATGLCINSGSWTGIPLLFHDCLGRWGICSCIGLHSQIQRCGPWVKYVLCLLPAK